MKLVLTYVDSEEAAELIAKTLLENKLAACVGIFQGKSRYWWKKEIHHNDNEFELKIKTKESLVTETINKIKEVHPYDLPVIEVINTETNEGVKEWIDEVCKNG